MTEQQFEDLAKRWPDLFQKSGDFELSVGNGWYSIIDTLCGLISYKMETAKRRLKYALENPNANMKESVAELEAAVSDELEKLPTIAQVKEKFGGLRFYVDGGSTEIDNYITFAESIACYTCEVCGAPGERRSGNWVRTLCNTHYREQEEKDSIPKLIPKTTPPNLFD